MTPSRSRISRERDIDAQLAMNGKDRFYLSQPEHRGWIDEPLRWTICTRFNNGNGMAIPGQESFGTQQWVSRSTCEPLGGWITGVTQ